MKTVSFTRMEDGTVEDYALLAELEEQYVRKLPDRLMDSLSRLQATLPGYPITRALSTRCNPLPEHMMHVNPKKWWLPPCCMTLAMSWHQLRTVKWPLQSFGRMFQSACTG